MSKPTLTVAMIGYQFMGMAHSNAYRQVGRYFDLPCEVRMKTLVGRREDRVRAAADRFGWEGFATDYRAAIDDPEVDIIDIGTPQDSHAEIGIAAAKAGKVVFCEKPMARNLAEAEQFIEAVRASGRPSLIWHNYRRVPAIALAHQILQRGDLGEIRHWRATYLQDWLVNPQAPRGWHLQKEIAGSGSLGDIGVHITDLAQHLIGPVARVTGFLKTITKERPLPGSGEMAPVDVDDVAMWLAEFANGVTGTFEATRFATGRKNYNRFEVNGSKGSLAFNLERFNELEVYFEDGPAETRGWRTIQATDGCHPFMSAYWPAGHVIGYEHTFINTLKDALTNLTLGQSISPSLEDGLRNQRVLDAVERSAASRTWIEVDSGPT